MIVGILTTVVGALLTAAIFAGLKSRRLYVIVPKLYLNAASSGGQIVSLTIFNAGALPEEDVALSFRSACKFDLIATSKSTLAVNGQTLSLPKLSRGESVTIVVRFDDSKFTETDIESVESRATTGKVVDSKEKASSVTQHLTIWPILFLFFSLPFVFGTFVGSELGMSPWGYLNSKLELMGESKQLAGYKLALHESLGTGKLQAAIQKSKINVVVQEVVRRDDLLYVTLQITNATDEILVLDFGDLGGLNGDGPLPLGAGRIGKMGFTAAESKKVNIKAYVPESTSAKILTGSLRFSNATGDFLHADIVVTF